MVAEIGRGLLLLAGVSRGDSAESMTTAAGKISALRIFGDADGKMNLSLFEVGGEILAVSQFTLAGSISRGRRPSFDNAEEPGRARELFDLFVEELRSKSGCRVATGRFREMMSVSLDNDGPVTFVYDVSQLEAKS